MGILTIEFADGEYALIVRVAGQAARRPRTGANDSTSSGLVTGAGQDLILCY